MRDGQSVGEIHLGDGVSELVGRAVGSLARTRRGTRRERAACELHPEQTIQCRARPFNRASVGRTVDLILLDPLDAELHRIAAPVYLRALDEHAALSEQLVKRAAVLQERGFHAQVKVGEQARCSSGRRRAASSRAGCRSELPRRRARIQRG